MALQTIGFKTPSPKCGIGMPLAEGSDIPIMRPRTGPRGTDKEMIKLLESAMDNLADSICSFWACNGPRRPRAMCTCVKCYAMREVGTVIATLKQRAEPPMIRMVEPVYEPINPADLPDPSVIAGEIVSDLRNAIDEFESINNSM